MNICQSQTYLETDGWGLTSGISYDNIRSVTLPTSLNAVSCRLWILSFQISDYLHRFVVGFASVGMSHTSFSGSDHFGVGSCMCIIPKYEACSYTFYLFTSI